MRSAACPHVKRAARWAQADILRTEAHWTLNEALTWSRGNHVVKGGIQVPDFSRRGINDRSNSAGTFYGSSSFFGEDTPPKADRLRWSILAEE
ncbi:MAG TPA: hypothetical protein VE715_08500 [Blastocatellia bacterium]|nr:hypothetical protein [Blastocatellia bacterium]